MATTLKQIAAASVLIAIWAGVPWGAAWPWPGAAPASGLLPLSAQTFPVPDVPVDVPQQPAADGAAPGISPDAMLQYGLLDTPGIAPSAYDYHLQALDYQVSTPPTTALAPVPSLGLRTEGGLPGWTLGARNWRYADAAGHGLTIGNAQAPAPALGRGVRLAGLRLAGSLADSGPGAGWEYAVAAGALDDIGSGLSDGALDYGPAAYDVSARHAFDSGLSLATQAQGAAGQLTTGLGGQYAAGPWGTAALGVSRSQRAGRGGWGYRAGYALDLPWDARLSWQGRQRGPAYSDLALLQAGADACRCHSQRWELGLDAGPWGRFSGVYERQQLANDGLAQRFGVAQRFRLGERLRVRLQAEREPTAGTYGLAARLSFPLY